MKKLIVSALVLASVTFAQEIKLEKPPQTLSKYYPPNSNKFEFLNSMYAMSTAFTGMFVNIQENDWNNALKWANILRENYLNIGKFVPEYDKALKKSEIDQLVNAVKEKNFDKVKLNADIVGKSCAQCHQKQQITTKIMYHYPSFSLVNLEDPVSRSNLEFEDYMKKMTDSMKKIRIYLEDNKPEKAIAEGNNFVKRLKSLSQSCNDCHTNKMSVEIYQGKELDEKLDLLSKAIQSKNKQEVYKNLSWISMNNCSKCHNTHQTTAHLKEMLK